VKRFLDETRCKYKSKANVTWCDLILAFGLNGQALNLNLTEFIYSFFFRPHNKCQCVAFEKKIRLMSDQVHYEVFSRKTPQSPWVLQMATEDKDQALRIADDLLDSHQAVSAKVTKEVFNTEVGEFRSYQVISKGLAESKTKIKLSGPVDQICVSPQDLYTSHARSRISRLLEDWLKRNGVTTFELLHRPDLCEKLEASSNELMHAIQKVAIPEAQETGQSIHELIRRWSQLVDRALSRVIQDGRKKSFPDLSPQTLMAQIEALKDHAERGYILGGGIAKLMTQTPSSPKGLALKLDKIMELITPLMGEGPEYKWAVAVVEAPVAEIFSPQNSVIDILGQEADLGTCLSVLTRMAAGKELERVAMIDPNIRRILPPLSGPLAELSLHIGEGHFPELRRHIFKRLMSDLKGPRRLRPHDPVSEIETLRAMAMTLSSVMGDETQREDITNAFVERSKMLVSSNFVEQLISSLEAPIEHIERLIWLCENVAGSANKRQAAQWLNSALSGVKFEREMRDTKRPAGQKLVALAQLQNRLLKANLSETDCEAATHKLGHVGALIAEDVKLFPHIIKGSKNPLQRVMTLLSFASAQAGPLGAVCEQAKAEVMKQLRTPEMRQYISGDPSVLNDIRPLLAKAGLGG
jgi:hypothetical protein